jgi:hypothetical protein
MGPQAACSREMPPTWCSFIPGFGLTTAVITADGARRLVTMTKRDAALWAITRPGLLQLLDEAVPETVRREERSVDDATELDGDLVVAADGARSVVRKAVWGDEPRDTGVVAIRGVLDTPPDMPLDQMREFWGDGMLFGVGPNRLPHGFGTNWYASARRGEETPAEALAWAREAYAGFPSRCGRPSRPRHRRRRSSTRSSSPGARAGWSGAATCWSVTLLTRCHPISVAARARRWSTRSYSVRHSTSTACTELVTTTGLGGGLGSGRGWRPGWRGASPSRPGSGARSAPSPLTWADQVHGRSVVAERLVGATGSACIHRLAASGASPDGIVGSLSSRCRRRRTYTGSP